MIIDTSINKQIVDKIKKTRNSCQNKFFTVRNISRAWIDCRCVDHRTRRVLRQIALVEEPTRFNDSRVFTLIALVVVDTDDSARLNSEGFFDE